MTREDAKNTTLLRYIPSMLKQNEIDLIIDKIYDDFESRTCENCKHFNIMQSWTSTADKCMSDISKAYYVDKDFGCNKWEAKDNK